MKNSSKNSKGTEPAHTFVDLTGPRTLEWEPGRSWNLRCSERNSPRGFHTKRNTAQVSQSESILVALMERERERERETHFIPRHLEQKQKERNPRCKTLVITQ